MKRIHRIGLTVTVLAVAAGCGAAAAVGAGMASEQADPASAQKVDCAGGCISCAGGCATCYDASVPVGALCDWSQGTSCAYKGFWDNNQSTAKFAVNTGQKWIDYCFQSRKPRKCGVLKGITDQSDGGVFTYKILAPSENWDHDAGVIGSLAFTIQDQNKRLCQHALHVHVDELQADAGLSITQDEDFTLNWAFEPSSW